jgi:hypothetical protein
MLIRNLFFLFSVTIVAIASTVLSVFNYNPYDRITHQIVTFYLSLFCSSTGLLSLLIYYLKIFINKREVLYSFFWPSVREAAIISAGLTLLLVLRGLKLLDLWSGIPLFVSIILLELFFRTKKPAFKKI